MQQHALGTEDEAALEAHVGVLAVALYLGPGAPDVAGDGGAAQPDVGGGRPQPQMPVVALGAFCLGW